MVWLGRWLGCLLLPPRGRAVGRVAACSAVCSRCWCPRCLSVSVCRPLHYSGFPSPAVLCTEPRPKTIRGHAGHGTCSRCSGLSTQQDCRRTRLGAGTRARALGFSQESDTQPTKGSLLAPAKDRALDRGLRSLGVLSRSVLGGVRFARVRGLLWLVLCSLLLAACLRCLWCSLVSVGVCVCRPDLR